jgi:hypothetical protein
MAFGSRIAALVEPSPLCFRGDFHTMPSCWQQPATRHQALKLRDVMCRDKRPGRQKGLYE